MRTLGIDYGDARVGIAITDPLNITAQGLETIQRNTSSRQWQNRIKKIRRNIKSIWDRYNSNRDAYKHEWN